MNSEINFLVLHCPYCGTKELLTQAELRDMIGIHQYPWKIKSYHMKWGMQSLCCLKCLSPILSDGYTKYEDARARFKEL